MLNYIFRKGYGESTDNVSKILNKLTLDEKKDVEEFLKRLNKNAFIEYNEKIKKNEEFYLNPNFEEDLEEKIKKDLNELLEKKDYETYAKMKRIFKRGKQSLIEDSKNFKEQYFLNQKNIRKHTKEEIYSYKKELFIELYFSRIHNYNLNNLEDFL